jgi:hypothetical protein
MKKRDEMVEEVFGESEPGKAMGEWGRERNGKQKNGESGKVEKYRGKKKIENGKGIEKCKGWSKQGESMGRKSSLL